MTGAHQPTASGAAGGWPRDDVVGRRYEHAHENDNEHGYAYSRGYVDTYEPGYGYALGYEPGRHPEPPPGGAAGTGTSSESAHWYDDEAGPLVRLYALTRGRARSDPRVFNLLALVTAESGPYDDPTLGPEQVRVLELCCHAPQSVAEIAAYCDLPLGVARVLLGDLLEIGHIRVRQPMQPAALFDERILQEVINGLRAL